HGFQLQGSKQGSPLAAIDPDPSLAFTQTWEDGRIAPVVRLMERWAQAVRSRRPMLPGLLEGLVSQRYMDASLRSHQQQRSLILPA
ncbi:MAG: gfo/Idh/MocA family oxidoreductase, partial [Synechococcaceae bacterium WB6_3B_236]|nr:gfo/Idh/MocA family oxidoreductase [Synechococcaceae bacterium WB6_3B_236]